MKEAFRDVLLTQRAVRELRPDAVDLTLLLDCVRLATHAPSGTNRQAWEWVIVRDAEVKRGIADLNRPFAERYAARDDVRAGLRESVGRMAGAMHEAPAIVVPCYHGAPPGAAHHAGASFYASIYPAVQNFLLAAHAAGLGATLTTMALRAADDLRALLALPDDVWPCAVIPVGWPRTAPSGSPRRRPVDEVVHLDRFGGAMP